MFADILKSDLSWPRVHQALEVNAIYWASDTSKCRKVYEYLKKRLKFNEAEKVTVAKAEEWMKKVKQLSTSRSLDFAKYLIQHLEDESKFAVEDWSKYNAYGFLPKDAKPDLVDLRVCDVALVALLRTLHQFEIVRNPEPGPRYHSLIIKAEILSPATIKALSYNVQTNRISLKWFAREIKLTPVLKQKVKAFVNARRNKN